MEIYETTVNPSKFGSNYYHPQIPNFSNISTHIHHSSPIHGMNYHDSENSMSKLVFLIEIMCFCKTAEAFQNLKPL